MGDGGPVAWIRVSPHAAQPCPSQSSYDPAAIGSEDQTVSKEDPNQADETENDAAVHDGAQRVLGPHEPPVKEGQARHDHGEYEGGRRQYPGGIPAVVSRRDRRRRRPLRPRASCPEGTPHRGRKDGDPVPRYGRHNALLVRIVFLSSRRRHTRFDCDWSSDVCSSDLCWGVRLDAVGLEVMAHAFASVAEEMGLVLVHSALSPNIRERRDASAALFATDGEMIAQAAHIPVHLGALADAVAAVRALEPQPGELFILNDPYAGGSHLPDLTLIGAIEIDGHLGGYSVVRAHHSDVGGMTPGSMPAGARELYQEGFIIPPTRLTPDIERLLFANVRTPAMRRGDLAAQRAAVERGAQGLSALARRHGWAVLRDAAHELLDYAERRTNALVARVPAGPMTAGDCLEGGGVVVEELEISVKIKTGVGVFRPPLTCPPQPRTAHRLCR